MTANKYHHIKIALHPYDAGHTPGTVEIDGVPVNGVRAFKVEGGYNRVTEVTLTLTLLASVEVDADGAVVNTNDARG